NSSQAESGPLASLFGCIKGLEKMRFRLGVHPIAGVADCQHHIRTGPDVTKIVICPLVNRYTTSLDFESPASRHRITSIDYQIHPYLIQLPPIRPDPLRSGVQGSPQLNVLPDQPVKHFQARSHNTIKINDLDIEHLLPAECKELLSQCSSPFARTFD